MGELWDKLGYYRRMATGLRQLLRTPPHSDPERVIRLQMENRERLFLDLAQRIVFSNPEHPYHQMFQLAGCTFGDLKQAVDRDGLESTLASLHRQGVYLAHDEFKRKRPIRRSNREIPSDDSSFRNLPSIGAMEGSSGGSRSAGTKVRRSIPSRLHIECYRRLLIREFGLANRAHVLVRPILPAPDGIVGQASYVRLGWRTDRWFSTVSASLDSAHYALATRLLIAFTRMHGQPVNYPSSLPPDDFSPVAEWVAMRKRQGVACAVDTYPSPASRIAAAAEEKGLDIAGALFLVGGETLTDARRRLIERVGAQVFPFYPVSEIGPIGYACRHMTSGNCVHQCHDSVAAINFRRQAPLSEVEVNSLLFTTLSPHAPFFFINVEMDDAGVIEPVACECVFGKIGFNRQIRDISSYGKLTGQGVTLMGTDALRVLEEALPERFGGCATDYQLTEQDGDLQTRLVLRVSRRLPVASTEEVKEYFLRQLRRFEGGAGASRIWRDTNSLQVLHENPIPTARGKVLPLHLTQKTVASKR